MAVQLDRVVPWGRSLAEYERMFLLTSGDYASPVLDCAGGPASFAAEASELGRDVVSVDPIYAHSGEDIRERFEATAPGIAEQIQATLDDWVWTFHQGPSELLAYRRATLERFLADLEPGRRGGRYLVGELPGLPFEAGAFGLALCSHLLFVYSHVLSFDFHVAAVRELCRVAREVRVFPITALSKEVSPHHEGVRRVLEEEGWRSEVIRADYEIQRGANAMLRVFRD